MIIKAGLRIGFWKPGGWNTSPFICKGYYIGPEIGDIIIGHTLTQELMEGTLRFNVGVLFRPELHKKQRLETILIFENYIEEMWNYDTWESLEEHQAETAHAD